MYMNAHTGNIGCMVNGAGLAMATMDIIKVRAVLYCTPIQCYALQQTVLSSDVNNRNTHSYINLTLPSAFIRLFLLVHLPSSRSSLFLYHQSSHPPSLSFICPSRTHLTSFSHLAHLPLIPISPPLHPPHLSLSLTQLKGGDPANFLDVGGGATSKQVEKAFELLNADPNVKVILVNIFGELKCSAAG